MRADAEACRAVARAVRAVRAVAWHVCHAAAVVCVGEGMPCAS